jgi:hypothetical protein|tara:strand:- start:66 stop:371 length:306 start_codon:yes stop_codon:yes gene_type:complete
MKKVKEIISVYPWRSAFIPHIILIALVFFISLSDKFSTHVVMSLNIITLSYGVLLFIWLFLGLFLSKQKISFLSSIILFFFIMAWEGIEIAVFLVSRWPNY